VSMERKLTAILSADVKDYSRLMGEDEEARKEVAEILPLSPHFSLEGLRQRLPYKDPADVERALAALRKADLK